MSARIFATLLLITCASVSASSTNSDPIEQSCRAHPQLIGQCFNVHGRLSTYNGAPAVRLWRIGSTRVLGVSDQRFKLPDYRNLPDSLAQQLNGENEIVGDFLVCPFTKPKLREMQLVCIESAKKTVVRNRKQ